MLAYDMTIIGPERDVNDFLEKLQPYIKASTDTCVGEEYMARAALQVRENHVWDLRTAFRRARSEAPQLKVIDSGIEAETPLEFAQREAERRANMPGTFDMRYAITT